MCHNFAMTDSIVHPSASDLAAGLSDVMAAPTDNGTLEMIVRRPAENEREVLEVGELDVDYGLMGDTWIERRSPRTDDGSAHPDMQLNIMNARVTQVVAGDRSRWMLAGDQLYADLDLSLDALPAGTRLAIGDAVIEVTDQPHRGCKKFTERFGIESHRWVNSDQGKSLNLRGINARVVQGGAIRQGDSITRC